MMLQSHLRFSMPMLLAVLVTLTPGDSSLRAAEPGATKDSDRPTPAATTPDSQSGLGDRPAASTKDTSGSARGGAADGTPEGPASTDSNTGRKQPSGEGGLMRGGGSKTFQTGSEQPPPDANDPMALLARCDSQLEQCKTDHIGMPYLVAAYLALWTILLGYFVLARRGQQKLESELAELRQRLRDYEEAFLQEQSGDAP